MEPFENSLKEELENLKRENLFRERWVLPSGVFNLCSNDYLGLSKHPKVVEAAVRAAKRYGTSAGASQLVSGYTSLHRELEQFLATLKGCERCITFGSGYLANIGVLSALFGRGDVIFSDQLNHASIIDGVRLSGADKFIYPHRDIETLESLLREKRKKYRRCGIVTDGVFSMDGDIAPLKELDLLAKSYNCALIVDDAHATGTLGFSTFDHLGFKPSSFVVQIGTFSKALGSYGAYVCGSEILAQYLVNRARSLIFSTALPPAAVGAALQSLKLLKENHLLVEKLKRRSSYIKGLLKEEGFNLGLADKYTPIVPLIFGKENLTLKVRDCLLKKGFFVQAIRYPTVERGAARLRLTISLKYPIKVYEDFVESLKECAIMV